MKRANYCNGGKRRVNGVGRIVLQHNRNVPYFRFGAGLNGAAEGKENEIVAQELGTERMRMGRNA